MLLPFLPIFDLEVGKKLKIAEIQIQSNALKTGNKNSKKSQTKNVLKRFCFAKKKKFKHFEPGARIINLFTAQTYTYMQEARPFVSVIHFSLSLTFSGMVRRFRF